MTNGHGKSDRPIVPEKPSNKAAGAPAAAERVEGRGLTKGNPRQHPMGRTQSRATLKRPLWRIRQVAEKEGKAVHHAVEAGELGAGYRHSRFHAIPNL
jgi:hypothetical protein